MKPDARPMPLDKDRKGSEGAKGGEDKVVALRAYRKAQGQCFTCRERWTGRDHWYATTIQLHVVEELLVLMMAGTEDGDKPGLETKKGAEDLMTISKAALSGEEIAHTVRLQGLIQRKEVLMLVDSGSSNSFISEGAARHLSDVRREVKPIRVQVAGGGVLTCSEEIPGCEWWIGGETFCTTLKVLLLACYDVILGIDWLEGHSPMEADWQQKHLTFVQNGRKVRLQGVRTNVDRCEGLNGSQLKGLGNRGAIAHLVHLCAISELPGAADFPKSI
ncbi:uncharacterized protein LOC133896745 [Phragmites australis]|uniref:uncharacterized protein LOC133896745 n=1 Tax=Phragmites australis TaxID=29695 RepID=UPI002D7956AA|nr:uncharacterized protein LOC133896745 [Phragmites australis]